MENVNGTGKMQKNELAWFDDEVDIFELPFSNFHLSSEVQISTCY